MRQLEEKIRSLSRNLQDLQSTMNERFQEVSKNGFGGGGSGGRNPADAAQPEIKQTIHSIQTKLDQLDNRTQVSPFTWELTWAEETRFETEKMYVLVFCVSYRLTTKPWSALTTTW